MKDATTGISEHLSCSISQSIVPLLPGDRVLTPVFVFLARSSFIVTMPFFLLLSSFLTLVHNVSALLDDCFPF